MTRQKLEHSNGRTAGGGDSKSTARRLDLRDKVRPAAETHVAAASLTCWLGLPQNGTEISLWTQGLPQGSENLGTGSQQGQGTVLGKERLLRTSFVLSEAIIISAFQQLSSLKLLWTSLGSASFSRHLVSAFCIPSTVLHAGETAEDKTKGFLPDGSTQIISE